MTLRNAGILLATPVALSSMQLSALFCFRSNSMKKNTGNCNYQERAGKIILRNITNEHVTGAEIPGNFRRVFLAVTLKQWKVSVEGRLVLSPH
jgi:hypothetical protein